MPIKVSAESFARVQVADPFIELHTGPGRGFPIFYVAEQGEWVEVLRQKTGWYRVRLENGKEGWVHRRQMARTLAPNQEQVALHDPDFQEYLDRTWEFGVGHGDFAGAAVISAYGGWHFTRNLSLEMTLTQALGNFSEVDTATLSLLNEPFPEWRVSPFFGVGGGALRVQPRATLVQVVDRQDDVVFVTAGVRSYLTRRFLVRLDYRSFVVLTSRNDNEDEEEWKIGFSIFF
jgi:hypothetical protein